MADINDIVLIHVEEKPQAFARIESIEPDIKRGWYHLRLLLLQIPLQVITWILRDVYINGETFTMDGKPIRLERVVSPEPPTRSDSLDNASPAGTRDAGGEKGKVISLFDPKKKA